MYITKEHEPKRQGGGGLIRAGEPEPGVFGSLEPEPLKKNEEPEPLGKKVRSRSR